MKILSLLIAYCFILKTNNHISTKDILVLYDSVNVASSHKTFSNYIKQIHGIVDVDFLSNRSITLTQYSQLMYKNLVLFLSENKKFTGKIDTKAILDFIDAGGNLILFVDPMKGTDSNKLIAELGFTDSQDKFVIDHQNYQSPPNHLFISIPSTCVLAHPGVITKLGNSILYKGKGFALDPSNPLTFPIITADTHSYLATPDFNINEFPIALGKDIVVIGGLQARNKARAVVIGSSKIFSDEFLFSLVNSPNKIATEASGNFQIMKDVTNWAFQKHSVIRVSDPKHVLVSTMESYNEYIVETLLQYSLKLEVLDSDKGWIPFISDDIQLELIRLTLFSRLTYNHSNTGLYTAQFFAPDFIGTYNLETRYRKIGFTPIDYLTKIVIRPRKHNDYERFLTGAWPYYSAAFLMMGLVLVLTFLLLNEDKVEKIKTE